MALPRYVSALPDELLGSYAWRFSSANALLSPFELVPKERRKARDIAFRYSDHLTPSLQTDSYLKALGFTYDQAVNRLTTYPYWQCYFKTNEIDRKQVSRAVAAQTAPMLSANRRLRGRTHLNICPACVKSDYKEHEVSYFHRSHQLPGSYACHRHHLQLESRCPYCAIPYGDTYTGLLLPDRCECGYRLGTATKRHRQDSPIVQLAQFDHAALHSEGGSLQFDGLFAALDNAIAQYPKQSGTRPSIPTLLEQHFGTETLTHLYRRISHGEVQPMGERIVHSTKKVLGSPVLLAGTCLALGYSFDEAVAATKIANSAPESVRSRQRRPALQLPVPASLQEAKEQIIQLHAKFSGTHQRAEYLPSRAAYWMVRLMDNEWLERTIPLSKKATTHKPIPSISSDRALLKGQVHRRFFANGPLQKAYFRAHYRDNTWLTAQLNKAKKLQSSDLIAAASALRMQLANARETFERQPSSRRRFSCAEAARIVGLSKEALAKTMKRLEVEREEVLESVEMFAHRRTTDAYKQLQAELASGSRMSISASAVAHRAGINKSASTYKYAFAWINKNLLGK